MAATDLAARWWCDRFSSLIAEAQIVRQHVARLLNDRPLRVLIDFARIGPGGSNGGIKVFTLGILQCLKRIEPAAASFLWVVQENLVEEALVFADPSDEIWVLAPEKPEKDRDPRLRLTVETGPALAMTTRSDVLYAPVGATDLHGATIPTIGIAVDVLHRDYPDTLPPAEVDVREAWFERMTREYRFVQCISEWTAGRVRHHYPHCRASLFTTHCAMPAPDRQPVGVTGPAETCFLYPANSWAHKNHDTLLVGYRHYLRSHRGEKWKLALTGFHDAATERILEHGDALGLRDHVECRGHLRESAYAELWAKTGALIFASQHEGFGIPILEAMQRGIPVVADRIGSIPEVAGDACLFADMKKPAEIARALVRIQVDSRLRERLVAEGYRRASTFSLEREAKKLLTAFRKCAAESRRQLSREKIVVI